MVNFVLDDDEKAKFDAWESEHYKTCKLQPGTAGDLHSFRLCPTGIGTFISVKCPCGASEDLTGDL